LGYRGTAAEPRRCTSEVRYVPRAALAGDRPILGHVNGTLTDFANLAQPENP
jgi:hypothetical protein